MCGKRRGDVPNTLLFFPFYYSGNWLLSPFANFARVPQPSLEEEGTGDVIIVGRRRCFHPFHLFLSLLQFSPSKEETLLTHATYRTRIGRMKTCMHEKKTLTLFSFGRPLFSPFFIHGSWILSSFISLLFVSLDDLPPLVSLLLFPLPHQVHLVVDYVHRPAVVDEVVQVLYSPRDAVLGKKKIKIQPIKIFFGKSLCKCVVFFLKFIF